MNGVCRKSFLTAIGSAFAVSAIRFVASIASDVLFRAASAACLMELEVDIVGEEMEEEAEGGW
jgi:hypothetical protein